VLGPLFAALLILIRESIHGQRCGGVSLSTCSPSVVEHVVVGGAKAVNRHSAGLHNLPASEAAATVTQESDEEDVRNRIHNIFLMKTCTKAKQENDTVGTRLYICCGTTEGCTQLQESPDLWKIIGSQQGVHRYCIYIHSTLQDDKSCAVLYRRVVRMTSPTCGSFPAPNPSLCGASFAQALTPLFTLEPSCLSHSPIYDTHQRKMPTSAPLRCACPHICFSWTQNLPTR
jgi:hypothetical protein